MWLKIIILYYLICLYLIFLSIILRTSIVLVLVRTSQKFKYSIPYKSKSQVAVEHTLHTSSHFFLSQKSLHANKMMLQRDQVSKKPHILVIPFPAQGHLNPMAQFAKRLSAKGLQATIFSSSSATTTIAKNWAYSINLDYISYEFKEGEKPTGPGSYLAHIKRCVSENLPGLIEKYKRQSPDQLVLVYDSHLPWAGHIGLEHGVKVAPFFTQAAGSSAIYYHVYKGNFKVPMESNGIRLAAMPVLEVGDLPSSFYDGLYPAAMELHASQFQNLDKVEWILFNTFYELESEVS